MALSKILPASQDQFAGARNLIINGAVTINQRNSGAALTVNTASEFYVVDRFMGIGVASDGVYTLQQVADAPDNFVNSIKATVTTPDASIPSTGRYLIRHKLEGNTISQLNLGSNAAQAFTLSFYVKSSLTGTFGGSILNGAQDRSYPFIYTISSAGVWERKTVTIAGDTTGTWPTDNTKAMQIGWSLGVGSDYLNTAGAWVGSQEWGATGETAVIATNGATWQITGVQLEVGSATPFEHRSFGDELARCQRYYYFSGFGGDIHPGDSDAAAAVDYEGRVMAVHIGNNRHTFFGNFPVFLRAIPTLTFYSPHDGASANAENYTGGGNVAISASYSRSRHGLNGYSQTSTSGDTLTAYLEANAEL